MCERSFGVLLRAALAVIGLAPFAVAQPAIFREERAYPTGDRASSVILLERFTPAEVRAGEEFTCEIRITNLTRGPVENVQLVEQSPATFITRGVVPPPSATDGSRAVWNWKSLPPGATESLRFTGSTAQMDELDWCATVTFSTMACARTRIVEPKLVLEKTMPPAVMICDEIPIRLSVRNTGSGIARDVRITDDLPEGLVSADGRKQFIFDVGHLSAGQSRDIAMTARANRTGQFTNQALAQEAGGLSAQASATVTVTQPVLAVTKTGPNLRYLGRNATFQITVQNTGDAPARDTVLTDTIPAGLQLVGADNEGRAGGGSVAWGLGTLEPGASRTVQITLQANQMGRFSNTALARAYCAEVEAAAALDVMGIPAILLECVDDPDPIEIGVATTYTIAVINQGSSPCTNIVIDCTLPPEEEFIAANGPARAAGAGQSVRFDPLPSLAPAMRALYKVTVRGIRAGDARFKVSMTSDQTDTPVEETESTHVY